MLMNLSTTDKPDLIVGYIKLTIRLALILSTFLVLVSSGLRVLCGAVTFESYNLVYGGMPQHSVLISTWTIILTIKCLILIFIYNSRRKTRSWPFLKKEVTLLSITTLSVLIFVFTVMR